MANPLRSLKILDFSTLLPGPYATMLLGDMGAEVLRIESPDRVDLVKTMHPLDGEVSAAYSYLNRGKSSLLLDLKGEGGIEKVKELIKDYDILVEQFRPGVMDRLGIGYGTLREVNPRLIYCSITGYGQTGPYRDRAGHDINYLSVAGVSSHCGRAQSGPPPMGIQIADVAGGSHHAVMGILAAAIEREQTGEGQFVDISMTDAAFALNAMSGAACLAGGVEQEPESSLLNGGAFYDYYKTRDGRWLSVGSLEPKFAGRMCDTLGLTHLKDLTQSEIQDDQRTLKTAIKEKVLEKTLVEWQDIFGGQDACVEPVLTISEAAEHPQMRARDMVVDVDVGHGKTQRQIGYPIKFSRA